MGKLENKVAVITGATSGMALATAKLFANEGAHVFISGRRKNELDAAVKAIGHNVTGVQGDAVDDSNKALHKIENNFWKGAGPTPDAVLFAIDKTSCRLPLPVDSELHDIGSGIMAGRVEVLALAQNHVIVDPPNKEDFFLYERFNNP
jgi:NAD(P)-dependent dehydrogenase (short-subunit alcohol dehydrogenase family)